MEEGKLKLTFYGGVDSVTGANFLIEDEGTKILVDCGLIQGPRGNDEENPNYEPFQYDPSEIDYLILTHAHADHIGRVPKLIKEGFKGTIYSTPTTREISEVMLDDAAGLLLNDAERFKRDPLYTKLDIEKALTMWKDLPYHREEHLTDRFSIYLKDAGHILGSAMVYVKDKHRQKNIIFSGDLGNTPTPLIRDTEKINDADFLIMESVYGDRNHEGKSERKEKLKKALNKVIERKGTMIIPVFSLEKTQVLLHEMNDLIEGGEVKSVPVFFDSPLGIRLTDIYAKQFKNFNEKVQARIKSGDDIFDFPKLNKTYSKQESRAIHKINGPKIIVASSGMSVGGRIMDHEKKYLPDPKNAILFIGYQVSGTIGRAIREGNKKIKIDGKEIPIKAQIEVIDGYSSHKDSNGLINFVADTADRVKKVFVVMGESRSAMALSQKLRDNLGVNAGHPELGESFYI